MSHISRCLSLFRTSLLIAILALAASAYGSETYFKFKVQSPEMMQKLTRVVSLDNVRDGEVFAYANETELRNFESLGIAYEVLPAPSSLIEPEMAQSMKDIGEWDVYPTYEQYVAWMESFETNYPSLVRIVNIGNTVDGRQLLLAKISDNVTIEEDEPEVLYTSSIHGDELTGYVNMLRFIDSLLVSYGTDPRITAMVDSMEIWINPLANPDGTYAGGNSSVSGATRGNANFVDMNRNYPDPEDGQHPDGNSWQPETVNFMNLAAQQSFVISSNFHGGAEVFNYPWDTWITRHADDQWWQDVGHLFCDTAQTYSPSGYIDGFNDGISNGYDWYTISGGRQDYMNYFHGCREVTLEISDTKLIPASQLPNHWEYLKRSLLLYLEHSLDGIRGIVTDAQTSQPLLATVTMLGHDVDSSRVFTDPEVGDYHRMLEAGTYDMEVSAAGYYPDTILGVTVTDWQSVRVDVALTPLPNDPVIEFVDWSSADLIGPGDNASIAITLVNTGVGNATGVTGVLSSDDPYITVTQSTSTYPTLFAMSSPATSNTNYEFTVSAACPLYYSADFSLVVTDDDTYDDTLQFSIMIGQVIEDFESGDFTSYPWSLSGDSDWEIVSSPVYEGSHSAHSGDVTDDHEANLNLTLPVTENGEISFWYRVSSEATFDFLQFFIDGQKKGEWSGEILWTQATFPVTAGTHTFTWKYIKDDILSGGSDCAWLDYIVLPPYSSSVQIATSSLPDWTVNRPYDEFLLASNVTGTASWSDKNSDLVGTGLSLTAGGELAGTPNSVGEILFTAEVSDDAPSSDEKQFSVMINPAVTITTASLPDGSLGVMYSQTLTCDGGTDPINWSMWGEDLTGSGLTLNPNSGLLQGTIQVGGAINFSVEALDVAGSADTLEATIYVVSGCCIGDRGNVILDVDNNCLDQSDQTVDIGDLTNLISHLFITFAEVCCVEEADLVIDGVVDIGDLTLLINHLFITFEDLAPCQ